MGEYYVYLHRTATNGRVFYVGQGWKRRAWSTSGRNPHWHRTVVKYGYTIELIAKDLHRTCALSIERAVIAKYGRDNLTNLTDGGDIGPTGMRHSEKVRRAQSERLKGNSYTKGRKLSAEHRAAIREAGKGRVVSEATREKLRNRPVSAETRAKLSAANKGRVFTPEWLANMSKANTGKRLSDETKEKLRAIGKENARFGADNPSYGIPKTDAQKARLREAMLGRTFKPESIAKRSGKNHPRYDPTKYTLVHPDHGTITAERLEFRDRYGIPATKFTALIKGKRKSCRGWRLTTR